VSAKEAPLAIVKVTALAAYEKALAETGNEDEARFQAERSVRRAHGSSARTDMYDKQILVDHFKGKRRADDPEVQREFQRLRQQAQIDWEEMYAGNAGKYGRGLHLQCQINCRDTAQIGEDQMDHTVRCSGGDRVLVHALNK